MEQRGNRSRAVGIAIALGVFLAFYAVFVVGMSFVMLDEGPAPGPHRLALPNGVEVASSDEQCGSGGCWLEFTVRGRSPQADADDAMAAMTDRCAPGSVLDLRRVCWEPSGAGITHASTPPSDRHERSMSGHARG